MRPEHRQRRDAFLSLVLAEPPVMAAHDELSWDRRWPALLAQTREWRELALEDLDAGYFGDGSTATLEDYEHGLYLWILAERDD